MAQIALRRRPRGNRPVAAGDKFGSQPPLTMGVECELHAVDKITGIPTCCDVVLDAWESDYSLCQEFHVSLLEVRTAPHRSIEAVRDELSRLLSRLLGLGDALGIDFLASGTHPFSRGYSQLVRADERYTSLLKSNPAMAFCPIASLHLHVSVPDFETALYIQNAMRFFLPHFVALASNSPFFDSVFNNSKSERLRVLRSWSPLVACPPTFESPASFLHHLERLRAARVIHEFKDWWSLVRCRPDLGTVELRVMDMPSSLDDVIAIAACFQSLVATLLNRRWDLHSLLNRHDSTLCIDSYLDTNVHNAATFGLEADLVALPFALDVQPARVVIERMMAFIGRAADQLHTVGELSDLHDIVLHGSGADFQIAALRRHQCFAEVVADVVARFRNSCIVRGARGMAS